MATHKVSKRSLSAIYVEDPAKPHIYLNEFRNLTTIMSADCRHICWHPPSESKCIALTVKLNAKRDRGEWP